MYLNPVRDDVNRVVARLEVLAPVVGHLAHGHAVDADFEVEEGQRGAGLESLGLCDHVVHRLARVLDAPQAASLTFPEELDGKRGRQSHRFLTALRCHGFRLFASLSLRVAGICKLSQQARSFRASANQLITKLGSGT